MSPTAGSIVRASDIFAPIYVEKTASESVSSATTGTTLQNDDELFYELDTGTWLIESWLSVTGASGGDIKTAGIFTGTISTGIKHCLGPQVGTTDATNTAMRCSVHNYNTATSYGTDGTVTTSIRETYRLYVTAAGVFTQQWAQQTSSATNTTVNAASFWRLMKLA